MVSSPDVRSFRVTVKESGHGRNDRPERPAAGGRASRAVGGASAPRHRRGIGQAAARLVVQPRSPQPDGGASRGNVVMTVVISADMEGTAGVTCWAETERDKPDYPEIQALMTAEVTAACNGALDAGATGIIVKDAHHTCLLYTSPSPRD